MDILDTLQTHVLSDDNISREAKLKNFNTKTLWRILALYSYGTSAIPDEERALVADKAHAFLVYVCTTPGAGVLYPSTGLYPRPSDDEFSNARRSKLGSLEGAIAEDRYSKDIPVYNYVLSEFTQKLRPWSSLKHSELLITIFSAAPELIADFFLSNRDFSFAPKLSMTWIGYAACLFNAMQIPVPEFFGDRPKYSIAPPPVSIILANIIPLPVDRKALVKCLEPGSNLTSFFATRILVLALEKLEKVLGMLQGATRTSDPLWIESSKKLIDGFCQRIPEMKEVVRMYRSVPAENLLHKTLGSRLLRLYYEVVPRVALAANFDVSPLLVDTLKKLDDEETTVDAKAFGVIELENLVSIASHSPGMRWFNKASGASTLPFTALLQVLCSDSQNTASDQIRRVLNTIALESQILSKNAGLRPLLQALRCAANHVLVTDMAPIWPFLDNCINRCASTPIKYLELFDAYEHDEEVVSEGVSLLNVTIAEQLRFITASSETEGKTSLANFLILYFNAAAESKESSTLVHTIYKQVQGQLSEAGLEFRSLGEKADLEAIKAYKVMDDSESTTKTRPIINTSLVDAFKLEEILHIPIPDEEDASALTKWSNKNAEDVIEDAHASKLVILLSSRHTSVRKEALTNILKLAARLKESSYEEKDQIWLLLSELAESSRPHVDAGPVPSAFTAFATHAIEVLRNPLHPLYPKVNTFLTRSPMWPADKLPLAHDILHGEPSEDDRYYTEITWLLTYLLDALRRTSDLSVFHKKKWLEKILVLGANPYLRANLRTRILRVVYRATCIEGGSTTLTTRFGIISWLMAQRGACEREEKAVLSALMRRIWDTCDQARVGAWSRGGVQKLVEALP
jgi:nucleolar pre-ribosomal-associated protein 1